MENSVLQNLRSEYVSNPLTEKNILPDPIAQFRIWFDEVLKSELPEPNAMTLATCSTDFKPSARIVLLKGIDEGFIFFTNYQSRKGKELLYNPYASLLFHWKELHRQVRVEGRAEKLDAAASDAYFFSRPPGSQLSAIVSPQSEVVESREWLEQKMNEVRKNFSNENYKRPKHWGGYKLIPYSMEFWQGRENRLHDRIHFTSLNGKWKMERLAP